MDNDKNRKEAVSPKRKNKGPTTQNLPSKSLYWSQCYQGGLRFSIIVQLSCISLVHCNLSPSFQYFPCRAVLTSRRSLQLRGQFQSSVLKHHQLNILTLEFQVTLVEKDFWRTQKEGNEAGWIQEQNGVSQVGEWPFFSVATDKGSSPFFSSHLYSLKIGFSDNMGTPQGLEWSCYVQLSHFLCTAISSL